MGCIKKKYEDCDEIAIKQLLEYASSSLVLLFSFFHEH